MPDGIGIRIVCMLNEDEQDIYNQLAKLLVDRKKIKGKEYHYQEGEKFYVCLDDQPEKQKMILIFIGWIVYGLIVFRLELNYK